MFVELLCWYTIHCPSNIIHSNSILGCCFSTSTLAGVRLEIDGVDRGSRTVKLESALGELEQLLKINNDPIEFMCQVCLYPSRCLSCLNVLIIFSSFLKQSLPFLHF